MPLYFMPSYIHNGKAYSTYFSLDVRGEPASISYASCNYRGVVYWVSYFWCLGNVKFGKIFPDNEK